MSVCESCEYRDNPIGHCVDKEYEVIRNQRGRVISKDVPRIICEKLIKELPPEYIPTTTARLRHDEAKLQIGNTGKKTGYADKDLEKQQNNYYQFYKIAPKRVSLKEEKKIITKLEEDFFDEWIGLDRILRKIVEDETYKIPFSFLSIVDRIHRKRILFSDEDKDTLRKHLKGLTPKQEEALLTNSICELAKAWGCSKQAVWNRRKRAKEKIELAIESQGG